MANGIRHRRNYRGNGSQSNVVTKSGPLTIKRKLFSNGQEDLISEGSCYAQTFDFFCGLGIPQSEALSGVLSRGVVATYYAVYERV